jgi:hypothetical protein
MSWGAQSRSEDAKTPGVAGVRSDKPELGSCPVQPYLLSALCALHAMFAIFDFLSSVSGSSVAYYYAGFRGWGGWCV